MFTRMQQGVAALTAVALVATAMPLQASAASAKGASAQTRIETDASTDFSGKRRARRGNNAAAAAMFGMVAGTIATIAINEQRRKRERDYWRYRNGYYGGYAYGPGYYAPQPRYVAPAYRRYRPVHPSTGYYFGGPGSYYGGASSAEPVPPSVHN